MKSIATVFPVSIDDRVFFSDINISQIPIMQNYYRLLNNGKYTLASEYLSNSEAFSYGAWCLNLLENRLYAIEKYVINLEDLNLVTYGETEPSESELYDGMSWIG